MSSTAASCRASHPIQVSNDRPFAADYEQLRHDFNPAMQSLADMLGAAARIQAEEGSAVVRAAVVASEVRSLAGRSATAAREIKQLILTSTTKVNEGQQLVMQSGLAFDGITQSVEKVTVGRSHPAKRRSP